MHLDRLLPSLSGVQAQAARLLLARALLATGDPSGACDLAQGVWDEHQHAHEEAAAIIGECHACRGRFSDALEVLGDPALPATPSLERTLLHAVVALEERGEAWAMVVLGRYGMPRAEVRQMPLVKVLRVAWPNAWGAVGADSPGTEAANDAATVSDLASVPPFPRLAVRLGQALIQAGRADLAAHHLTAVLQFHHGHGVPLRSPLDRLVRPAAVDALCRAGRQAAAWRLAVTGFTLRGLFFQGFAQRPHGLPRLLSRLFFIAKR